MKGNMVEEILKMMVVLELLEEMLRRCYPSTKEKDCPGTSVSLMTEYRFISRSGTYVLDWKVVMNLDE
eukprot:15181025-Ditylum_brightwellii.AAC.1